MVAYTLDPYRVPGVVVVVVDGHATYTAESFQQGERFVEQLVSTAPIALPAPSDAEAMIARVLARITPAIPI